MGRFDFKPIKFHDGGVFSFGEKTSISDEEERRNRCKQFFQKKKMRRKYLIGGG